MSIAVDDATGGPDRTVRRGEMWLSVGDDAAIAAS
jgi:hypothetical protein